IATLDFKKANFDLFREFLGGIPWTRVLEGKEVQESWLTFKHHFLQAQDWWIPITKKSNKGHRRPAWMGKELLGKLNEKKSMYAMRKKGQVTWEERRNAAREYRDATRKARAHLELELAKDVRGNRNGFYKYISSKRKTRENVGSLLNGEGALVTEDAEKAEFLTAFFASVFTG
ncbi:hypothetical protein N309_03795, partial [Tinamus guttatus]